MTTADKVFSQRPGQVALYPPRFVAAHRPLSALLLCLHMSRFAHCAPLSSTALVPHAPVSFCASSTCCITPQTSANGLSDTRMCCFRSSRCADDYQSLALLPPCLFRNRWLSGALFVVSAGPGEGGTNRALPRDERAALFRDGGVQRVRFHGGFASWTAIALFLAPLIQDQSAGETRSSHSLTPELLLPASLPFAPAASRRRGR